MWDSNFWLELNYLQVAKAAQSCSAHFTALLYAEIYVDKLKADLEDAHRCAPPPPPLPLFSRLSARCGDALAESRRSTGRASRRLTFEDASQTFTISSLNKKSVEETQISLQVGSPQQMLLYCPPAPGRA